MGSSSAPPVPISTTPSNKSGTSQFRETSLRSSLSLHQRYRNYSTSLPGRCSLVPRPLHIHSLQYKIWAEFHTACDKRPWSKTKGDVTNVWLNGACDLKFKLIEPLLSLPLPLLPNHGYRISSIRRHGYYSRVVFISLRTLQTSTMAG